MVGNGWFGVTEGSPLFDLVVSNPPVHKVRESPAGSPAESSAEPPFTTTPQIRACHP